MLQPLPPSSSYPGLPDVPYAGILERLLIEADEKVWASAWAQYQLEQNKSLVQNLVNKLIREEEEAQSNGQQELPG